MMNNFLAHFIGTLAGTFIIFLILKAESFIWKLLQYDNESRNHLDWLYSDLHIFGTFLIIVLFIQFLIIRPIFNRLSNKHMLNRKNLVILVIVLSLTSGFLFGSFFGSIELGVRDIFATFGVGVILFSIYYLTTFWAYLKLAK